MRLSHDSYTSAWLFLDARAAYVSGSRAPQVSWGGLWGPYLSLLWRLARPQTAGALRLG